MHGFVKFLIVLLCSLLLCFCAVYMKAIQYNAMHKFVRILDNPQNLGKINHTKFGYLMTV